MRVIRGLHNITEQTRGCVLTIGNFDGLHLGHQALLSQLSQTANRHNCPSCLMTFEPLPNEFFHKNNPDARLTSTREKLNVLKTLPENCRPDCYLLLNFNQRLADMSADGFIQSILVESLNIKSLIIGDDFRFGNDRSGNFELLQKAGLDNNFDVTELATFQVENLRISSTRIREFLQENNFSDAEKMMGRPYSICGRITHGDERGRTIGFPTANIPLGKRKAPIHGVYSVTMHSDECGDIPGIANIGQRPTVEGEQIQLEVHLFDFDKEIYGLDVCVSFQQKIRDEKKFESIEALKNQITSDCEAARNVTATDNR